MPAELNPALAVIFIQYSRNALAKPYTDFERFEIFTTLLEELDPWEPYDNHRSRIEKDARSKLIESDLVRVELYDKWVTTARTARRRDNKDWNNFIAFVNAQLKFHLDLNYEQFRFLCDEMAGFRLNPLAENQKRSIFWGCVLRREWRFARIQEIIDKRERLEEFVGPLVGVDTVTDYAARIGFGLKLPSVPTSVKATKQDAKPEQSGTISQSSKPCTPFSPSTSNRSVSALRHAPDVMEVIANINQLEDRFSNGELDEKELSARILDISAAIGDPSQDMKTFGLNVEYHLKHLEHDVPDKSVELYNALFGFAMAAQGFVNDTEKEVERQELSQANLHVSEVTGDSTQDVKDSIEDLSRDSVEDFTNSRPSSIKPIEFLIEDDTDEPLSAVEVEMRVLCELAERLAIELAVAPSSQEQRRSASQLNALCSEQLNSRFGHEPESPLISEHSLSNSHQTESLVSPLIAHSATFDPNSELVTRPTQRTSDSCKVAELISCSEKNLIGHLSAETPNISFFHQYQQVSAGSPYLQPKQSMVASSNLVTAPLQEQSTSTAKHTNCSAKSSVFIKPTLESASSESSGDESSISIPIYFGHTFYGPKGLVYVDGPFNPSHYD